MLESLTLCDLGQEPSCLETSVSHCYPTSQVMLDQSSPKSLADSPGYSLGSQGIIFLFSETPSHHLSHPHPISLTFLPGSSNSSCTSTPMKDSTQVDGRVQPLLRDQHLSSSSMPSHSPSSHLIHLFWEGKCTYITTYSSLLYGLVFKSVFCHSKPNFKNKNNINKQIYKHLHFSKLNF